MFKGNKVYKIDKNGNKKRLSVLYMRFFKGLNIKFKGKNSEVIFHEIIPHFYSSCLHIGNECEFEFDSNNEKVKNLLVYANAFYSKFKIGKNFKCNGCQIHYGNEAFLSVSIGDNCLFADEIVLRVSDSHSLTDANGMCVNLSNGIDIGNHVWCSSRVAILKNVSISNGVVIGFGSVVTKDCDVPNACYAGVPAKLLKRDICWNSIPPNHRTSNMDV